MKSGLFCKPNHSRNSCPITTPNRYVTKTHPTVFFFLQCHEHGQPTAFHVRPTTALTAGHACKHLEPSLFLFLHTFASCPRAWTCNYNCCPKQANVRRTTPKLLTFLLHERDFLQQVTHLHGHPLGRAIFILACTPSGSLQQFVSSPTKVTSTASSSYACMKLQRAQQLPHLSCTRPCCYSLPPAPVRHQRPSRPWHTSCMRPAVQGHL